MKDCAPSVFLKMLVRISWALAVLYLCFRFIFFIDLFWRSMFPRLKGAHICFNHVYVQREMAFLLRL